MNNKFIELYKNINGTELNTFLLENNKLPANSRDSLRNKRIFYVVKANLDQDKDVYKIGISERGDNSAKGRLTDYVHFYGVSEKENKCLGVKLYLLLANVFSPDVTFADSFVRRLETKVKKQFKDKRERGDERIHVPLPELFQFLKENNAITDIERHVRQTPRLAGKEQGASSAVKRIVSHFTNRRGVELFEIEYMQGFKYDTNDKQIPFKRSNEKLPYSEIIQLPRGKTLVDEYIKKHNIKTRSETKSDTVPDIRITTQTTRRTRSGNKTVTLIQTVKPKADAKTLDIEVKVSQDKTKKLDIFQDGKKIASI